MSFYPYRYGNTGVRLGVGVYDRPFFNVFGTPYYKDNASTPAYMVTRGLGITATASGALMSQGVARTSIIPNNLGVGDLSLTGLLTPARQGVGSP